MKTTRSSIRGFQDQVHEDSNLFFFNVMRQVPLNILHLYFSIYSVELELHDTKVFSAHLC
jgi:hypothetical protein